MGSFFSCAHHYCTTDEYKEISSCERKKSKQNPYRSLKWTSGKVQNGIIPIELQSWVNGCVHSQQITILVLSNIDRNYHNNDSDVHSTHYIELDDSQNIGTNTYSMLPQDFADVFSLYIRVPYHVTETQMEIGIAYDTEYRNPMQQHPTVIHPSTLQKVCDTQMIKIPSLVLNRVFCIGDKVLANNPFSTSDLVYPAVIIAKTIKFSDGKIDTVNSELELKLYENYHVVEYTVKIDEFVLGFQDLKHYPDGVILDLVPNQIHSHEMIEYTNVIDACNTGYYRTQMEYDLILGSNDKNICQFYSNLRSIIANIYKQNASKNEKYHYTPQQRYNCEFVGGYISNIICNYIFNLKNAKNSSISNSSVHTSRYKIRCFHNPSFKSEDGCLCFQQLWKKIIRVRLNEIHFGNVKPIDNINIQEFNDNHHDPRLTHLCGLCNIEIHHNDWVAYCQNTVVTHEYCLSCTYTMINDVMKLENFLQYIIESLYYVYLNKDCIRVLVAFVLEYTNVSVNNDHIL